MKLFSGIKTAYGLDLSGNSFKLLQLASEKSGFKLQAFGEAAVPKGLLVNDAITDVKTFEYLIKQVQNKPQFGRFNTEFAVVSLPESKSFVRVIQIPKMSEVESQSAVPFEAESFIPLPLDQVYMDWKKIGETEDKMNILIIASPKDFVDSFLSILDQVQIKVIALEVESQACLRALIKAGESASALIVDMEATRSGLIMVEDGNLQFTSTIPIGGNNFTEAIAKSLGVASSKAEIIKQKVGMANTPEYPNIKTAALPILNNLSAEIKNILKFHDEHSHSQVAKIILTGGAAKLKNLSEFLVGEFTERPGLVVELGNPWLNINFDKNTPLSQPDALGFSTAVGLAMRGVKIEP